MWLAITFPTPSAGLCPITTCSLAKFDLALKFGAEKVFDYHSAACTAEIRAYTSGQLAYAVKSQPTMLISVSLRRYAEQLNPIRC